MTEEVAIIIVDCEFESPLEIEAFDGTPIMFKGCTFNSTDTNIIKMIPRPRHQELEEARAALEKMERDLALKAGSKPVPSLKPVKY